MFQRRRWIACSGGAVLVDEAGMLDQDTARALLTIADETGARVALVGDRRQLPAVGRGGVFDLAHRWVDPAGRVDLDTVHRFVRTVDGRTVSDTEYAQLSLAMRAGEDPGAVFDALHARGQIALYGSEMERREALGEQLAAARLTGLTPAAVVDTRDHAATLNAAIRDRLVAADAVEDHRAAVTVDGQRIGAGDAVVTRHNDSTLGVANRQTWTVARVHRDGRLTVHDQGRRSRELPADYVGDHLELGYATTGYGAQGETAEHAHLVMTDTTTTATAYVAMTRGRRSNTAQPGRPGSRRRAGAVDHHVQPGPAAAAPAAPAGPRSGAGRLVGPLPARPGPA
jgi:exodeoxyribonuclease V alpha subunit